MTGRFWEIHTQDCGVRREDLEFGMQFLIDHVKTVGEAVGGVLVHR